MVQGVITHFPDPQELKEAPVGVKYVVAPRPQNVALLDLCPHLQVVEKTTLPEVLHQFDESKFRQRVSNELDEWVLVLIQVHIGVSYQDSFLEPEAFQGLL